MEMKFKCIFIIAVLSIISSPSWAAATEGKSPCERPYLLDDALKLSTYFSDAKPMRACDEMVAGTRLNFTNDAAFRLAGMVELYAFMCPESTNGKNSYQELIEQIVYTAIREGIDPKGATIRSVMAEKIRKCQNQN
jgi:hypothetical protein